MKKNILRKKWAVNHFNRVPQITVIPTVLCIDGSKKCHWAENQLILAFPGWLSFWMAEFVFQSSASSKSTTVFISLSCLLHFRSFDWLLIFTPSLLLHLVRPYPPDCPLATGAVLGRNPFASLFWTFLDSWANTTRWYRENHNDSPGLWPTPKWCHFV